MASTPLLDLNTLTDRYSVRVDGTAYELRPVARMSVLELVPFTKKSERLAALARQRKHSKRDAAELEQLLNEVCRVILAAPAVVHDKLTSMQRMQVCQVFTTLRRANSARRSSSRTVAPPKQTRTGAR